jgi:hypothetical protein
VLTLLDGLRDHTGVEQERLDWDIGIDVEDQQALARSQRRDTRRTQGLNVWSAACHERREDDEPPEPGVRDDEPADRHSTRSICGALPDAVILTGDADPGKPPNRALLGAPVSP